VSQEVRALIFRMAAEKLKIRPGESRAFTANCSSWVSISRKGRSHAGFEEFRNIRILPSAG
jgi:hypothetical protein